MLALAHDRQHTVVDVVVLQKTPMVGGDELSFLLGQETRAIDDGRRR